MPQLTLYTHDHAVCGPEHAFKRLLTARARFSEFAFHSLGKFLGIESYLPAAEASKYIARTRDIARHFVCETNMQRSWSTVFVTIVATQCVCCMGQGSKDGSTFTIGDIRNCPTSSPIFPMEPLYRMEVLPGAGFDGLRSVDMGQVHAYNYSKCSVSNDGRYLLPDNVFLIPTMESHVQLFSEYFDKWDDYTSTVSSSASLQGQYDSFISAKFSSEFLSVKSHMYNDKSVTTRVQLRNTLFKVKLQPDSQLHPTFKSRLFDIAANIQNNNTDYAHYLAELMVREYGTHYITSMDAGAVLSQVDHIRSTISNYSDTFKLAVTAAASANFLAKFGLGASFNFSVSEKDTEGFIHNRTYSKVNGWGGPPFGPNMTATDWENGVPNAMVAIDRVVDPLYYAINPTTLPEMPESTVFELVRYVFEAISRYYKVNTRRGCTDVHSPNFDFQANLNDRSCKSLYTNFTFGGIYQVCQYESGDEDLCNSGPHPIQQANPLTGDMSCHSPYKPVHLHSGEFRHTTHTKYCKPDCFLHVFFCHQKCYNKVEASVVSYKTYWCVAETQSEQNSGYLFGGYYTSTVANPFLGAKSCPIHFIPLHLGEDITICVSDDYELGFPYSVPFAGFESCTTGNPLAAKNHSHANKASWPHACPIGFSQHLMAVDGECEINVCVKFGTFNEKETIPPRLPPFRNRKQKNPNATNTLAVIGVYGDIWYKNKNGDWVKDNDDSMQDGKTFLNDMFDTPQLSEHTQLGSSSSSSSSSLSNTAVAGLSVVSTIGLCTLIAVAIFAGYSIKKKRAKSRKKGDETYLSINEEHNISNPQESNA